MFNLKQGHRSGLQGKATKQGRKGRKQGHAPQNKAISKVTEQSRQTRTYVNINLTGHKVRPKQGWKAMSQSKAEKARPN